MITHYRRLGALAAGVAFAAGSTAGSVRLPASAASASTYAGAEGSIGVNNTSPNGGALEGTVSPSGDTSIAIPFGILGEYSASSSTFGIGIAGISTSGYAVGAEVLGTNPALFTESRGTGPALQLVTTSSSAIALQIVSKGSTGLTILTQNGGVGLQASANDGVAMTATGNTAGAFISNGPGQGYAFLGASNGIGIAAFGNDATSAQNPALYAQAMIPAAGVFDGTNSTGNLVFTIDNRTTDETGIPPSDGSNVGISGDLYITGGLYQCMQNHGGCAPVGAKVPKVPDTRTREGGFVRTYRSQSSASTIEDFGAAHLLRGSAYVRLDAAMTSALAGGSQYLVFVTPGGDSAGLYSTNHSAAGFEVHETGNGRSSLDFSYRIVAVRATQTADHPRVGKSLSSAAVPARASAIRTASPRQLSAPVANAAFASLLRRNRALTARTDGSSGTAVPVAGSEGATAYNNTGTSGSAIEATVASSGNTSEALPFGVFGEYTVSNSVFGAGALGISQSGYAVGAEAFGPNAAIVGLNAAATNGVGSQAVSTSTGQGMQIESAGPGITALAGGSADGIDITSSGGPNAVAATSQNADAATFTSTNAKTGGQGSGGAAVAGDSTGIGLIAQGYDNSSAHLPALLARSLQGGDIFDGYNALGSGAIFQIQGSTQDYSGIAPSTGSDVSVYGDVLVTGGIYQCSPDDGTCNELSLSSDAEQRQSEPTVEDFGEATLHAGSAFVPLDPKFADTTDRNAPYLVFLTANGDAAPLYYSSRSANGFFVRESANGRSNLSFSYRIVAKPVGDAARRFPLERAVAGPPRKGRLTGLRPAPRSAPRLDLHPRHLATLARVRSILGGR